MADKNLMKNGGTQSVEPSQVHETALDKSALDKQALLDSFLAFEASFRTRRPWLWLGTLVGPFVVSMGLLVMIWLVMGSDYVYKLVGTMLATFLFFGRFVILGGSQGGEMQEIARFLSSGQLFLMVTYMDLMVALLLAFHIGFVFRLPVIGPKVSELVVDGQFILAQNPWMKRATGVALTAFVLFPLAATGSIGGSIFGRLLGMTRMATFGWVAIGSILGNGVMYLGSDLINRYFDKDHPAVQIGGLLTIVLIIVFLERRYRKMREQFRKGREEALACKTKTKATPGAALTD